MTEYYYISVGISYLLLITAIILSIIKYKQTIQNEKWYIYYIIFVFCIELLSVVLPFFKIKSNFFLYQIYIAGEFFTVTGIFIKKLNLSKYSFVLTGLFSLFFITADRVLGQYQYNNDYSKAISNIMMIVLIGYSLIQDIRNLKSKSSFQVIDKTYFFYFTVSLFIFILQHQLIEFPFEYFSAIWIINNLMVCVLYSLFIKTFLQLKK
ncbi:hypothetical protein ACFOWU_16205 [Epilithonimonas zeae]|uniref:Uncharacterized protein n=1 Tax=Epilithonimonas zeae TaxID=1416779 RepID=A0A1N6I9I8_9FLAO|nr:hypothetical protein [Epilithonimonas zeae]SIO28681.1 hypothetical protein SAMN05444409_2455 [Epilithonimonas zeae]